MKKLITTKELQQWLGVSRKTIQAWKREARIAYVAINGKHLFKEDDVERFIQMHRVPCLHEIKGGRYV